MTAPRAARRPHVHYIGRVPVEPASSDATADAATENDRGEDAMDPPVKVVDDLFWLRSDDRSDPDVIAHLEAENRYTHARLRERSHVHDDSDQLFRELKSRLKETDSDAPFPWGDFDYYTRMEAGKAYRIDCRRPRAGGGEQVLLDVNAVAAGAAMCDVTRIDMSPDHSCFAYGVDFTGSETYQIRFARVGADAADAETIEGTTGDHEWGADNSTVFYLTHDEQHRPYKLWMHVRGQAQSEDVCLFTEEDEMFWMGIDRSLTGEYLMVHTSSKMTSEVHVLKLADATPSRARLQCVQPREFNVLYEVEHAGGDLFVIVTNADGAKNSKIMVARTSACDRANWRTLLPHSVDRKVDDVHVMKSAWAISGREHGFEQIWLVDAAAALREAERALSTATEQSDALPFGMLRMPNPDPVYYMGGARGNVEFDAHAFRFTYSSPRAPITTCAFDTVDRAVLRDVPRGSVVDADWSSVRVLKVREVPNCDPQSYHTQRLHATARDGRRIPISIVYKPSALGLAAPATPADVDAPCPLRAPAPMLLYAYGSYGISMDMAFDAAITSLCDRGVVYAVAHVRGGGEMGRFWYEDEGRLAAKPNTFSDFIACAEHLISERWTRAGAIVANGASAGGLLMGVVLNERPDLWAGVLSQVGFVDVLMTMSDPSIPLTVTEWEEWGNPNERAAYDVIRRYSPMDNVRAQRLPKVLLTAGLNDYRVAYWEPAKFAQRLREAAAGGSGADVLLKTDMGAGHFSFTDRYAYLREKAFNYAWMLHALGVRP